MGQGINLRIIDGEFNIETHEIECKVPECIIEEYKFTKVNPYYQDRMTRMDDI